MRLKSLIATAGAICFAAFLASPAFAQTKAGPTQPICANCHEAQWKSIDLTAHGAKSDASGSMCQACHGDATAHVAYAVDANGARRSATATGDPALASELRMTADYDAAGLLLGVELLGPCGPAVFDLIAVDEPEPVRRALRGVAPRELVCA